MNKLGLATLLDLNYSRRHRPVAYTKSDKGIVAVFEPANVDWHLLMIFIAINARRRRKVVIMPNSYVLHITVYKLTNFVLKLNSVSAFYFVICATAKLCPLLKNYFYNR